MQELRFSQGSESRACLIAPEHLHKPDVSCLLASGSSPQPNAHKLHIEPIHCDGNSRSFAHDHVRMTI
jgi:hypothetical protein